jgi:hypothetical protein
MTSEPVEGVAPPEASGQIPHVRTAPEVVAGQRAQAMAGIATPAAGLAVAGQIGQAIIAVAQEIGQPVVDSAAGGAGQADDSQPPSSGHAVCAGEVLAVADGSATGEPHGPPPTAMQTPPVVPVAEALPLTATALETGGAAAEAPSPPLDPL